MDKVGKYKILEKIGEGGMGVVYKALDPLLERMVAVKTISSRLDSEPDLRSKFFLEGRAAAQLSHKNVITVYDLGEDNGLAYLAMEFLEGQDLRVKIREREIRSLGEKLKIMDQICAGLAHAHGRRVIHRDVKPANVFITTSGQVKILDFGLARIMSAKATLTGRTPGSPNYMSPEQVRGANFDHRTDIFSAGVLFYELLTSKRPFEGDSVTSTLINILHHEPEPPRRIDPALPSYLTGIVMKALEKDPDARYQNLAEVIRDLRRFSPRLESAPSSRPEKRDDGSTILLSESGGTTFTKRLLVKAQHLAGPRSPAPRHAGTAGVQASLRNWSVRSALLLSAFLALALAARGIWRIGRDTQVSLAGTINASSPLSLRQGTTPSPGARAPKDTIPAMDTGARDASVPPSQTSSVNRGGTTAGAQRGLQPGDHSSESIPVPLRARETDETPKKVALDLKGRETPSTRGKLPEASADLREISNAAPSEPAVRKPVAQLAGYEKQRADDALKQMVDARRKAEAAEAGQYAAASLQAAQNKEAAATVAYHAEQFSDAAAAFFEATGLFLSAALEAGPKKEARENRALALEQEARLSPMRQQADLDRNAYEQERVDAVKAGAETIAFETYREAVQLALVAGAKWDREDYAGAKTDFEHAAAFFAAPPPSGGGFLSFLLLVRLYLPLVTLLSGSFPEQLLRSVTHFPQYFLLMIWSLAQAIRHAPPRRKRPESGSSKGTVHRGIRQGAAEDAQESRGAGRRNYRL